MMTAAPKPKKTPKGVRYGGRSKGTKNKATVAREELAKAELAASLKKAKAAGSDSKYAIHEMQKALKIAEDFAGKVQPNVQRAKGGAVRIIGGDAKLFGEWFDRWHTCLKELAKYQTPQMKAVEAPTPPPDPGELERKNRKRFGLRVFEGGREIRAPGAPAEDDESGDE